MPALGYLATIVARSVLPFNAMIRVLARRVASSQGLVLLATSLLGGCATMQNYLERDAPRLAHEYAIDPRADGTLRVVTFNVEHGRRIERAIAGLRSHPSLAAADVIMLQEMDGPGVEEIAKALG